MDKSTHEIRLIHWKQINEQCQNRPKGQTAKRLLIELGFSPLVIADRLGHEIVETTLNTYSHLFPHKRDEAAEKLQNCF